ncbi:rod shape-determining protein MreD [Weissella paramesenteroides]|jgi:rod shape-determining protein MreD|uniref:Rod shape-determining protein MreD n=2 Tax=Weissella paramesenteroides TaxID=1249 RepID=A0A5M9EN38_WEIPA|nr:rod shape-determining protein MreD [Weissella paramesenteroides]ATF40839.1 rod shape-determining protein MreD [Weissella paramesenteroides]EER74827.1 putative rod shape-determining protein MreD [Weissella paramesenteroides ATCC 33313]KAA8439047.1 rod shape-determining protein MreD [Weissella paramesenteroides]KAA8440245.1 rod shape-determining protein MreD [Weissella paramesenteroides]KAA8443844.1 rod shape-determining protein MreD [Weissella paramesenteroides]
MLKYISTTWIHFILVIIAIMLDGGISLYLAPLLFKQPMSASPMLSLIVVMMPVMTGYAQQIKRKWLYLIALFAGMLVDIFYTGIIGPAIIGFLLILRLAEFIQGYLSYSFSSSLAVWFVTLTAYMVYDYAAFGIISLVNLNVPNFIMFHLFPTIIVNLILFIVVYDFITYLYNATKKPDISSYDVTLRDLNSRLALKSRSQRNISK